MRSVGGGT
ncbi:hypothetical protein QE152_g41527, partial [Popillia japonica]